MSENHNIPPYAPVLIRLLQGIIYSDDRDSWQLLISYQNYVRDYFNKIGAELYLYETEGFAFLKQKVLTPDVTLPSLIVKRQLSYPVTLLCVLLLEKLLSFDLSSSDQTRLFVTRQEMIEMLTIFLSTGPNEAKITDSIDANINKLTDYGFLKKMPETDKFEVKRILKAKINADDLAQLKKQLEEYAGTI